MSHATGQEKEIKHMVKTIFILALLCLSSPSYGEIIYQWVDKNGTFNFTDDPGKVPSAFRKEVQQKVIEDVLETRPILPLATPAVTIQSYGVLEIWQG